MLDKGTSTLLLGPPGAGKTWSLVTYIEAGLDLAVLLTDPGGQEALLKAMRARNLPLDKLYYNYIPPATASWESMIQVAQRVNDMDYKLLSELKSGLNKQNYRQMFEVYKLLSNFIDARTGKELGSVDSWGPNMALGIDGLSGINVMSFQLMVGAKPSAHQGEWGVSMNIEQQLVTKLTSDLRCFVCLIAHVEKEPNPITGVPLLTASALGTKLAPKLPKDFGDVVLAKREGAKFFWSTTEAGVDLKAANLPLSNSLEPSFKQIVESWRKTEQYAKETLPVENSLDEEQKQETSG